MGEGGEEKTSALSLFRFHLSPFPQETPDTQATVLTGFDYSQIHLDYEFIHRRLR